MFADDTNLFFTNANISELFVNVNNELQKISKWFKLNKLSLNIKKTNFIMFSNKYKILNTESLNVLIDNIVIDQVHNTKFLGVIINSNLTWHDHIKAIFSKVSKSIGILLRIRKNVPNDVLLTIYHTLIEPYFSYCNVALRRGRQRRACVHDRRRSWRWNITESRRPASQHARRRRSRQRRQENGCCFVEVLGHERAGS